MKIGGFPKGVGIIARRPVAVAATAPIVSVVEIERDPEDNGVITRDPGRQPIEEYYERDPDDAPERTTPLAPPDRPPPLIFYPSPKTPAAVSQCIPVCTRPGFVAPDVTRPAPFKPAALPARSGPPQRPMPPGQTPTAPVTARPGVARARPVAPASTAAAPTPVTVRAGVRQPETEHMHPDGRKLKASDIPY